MCDEINICILYIFAIPQQNIESFNKANCTLLYEYRFIGESCYDFINYRNIRANKIFERDINIGFYQSFVQDTDFMKYPNFRR